jgi:hypothetical protein
MNMVIHYTISIKTKAIVFFLMINYINKFGFIFIIFKYILSIIITSHDIYEFH